MALQIVNGRLLSHPVNWLIVWITLVLAMMAYHVLHNAIAGQPENITPD